jgi:hypothetical protein
MQPLTTDQINRITAAKPEITVEHVREYQQLVTQLLNINPNVKKNIGEKRRRTKILKRVAELQKLFAG